VNNSLNNFLSFGSISVRKLSLLFFWIGALVLLVIACAQGYVIYLTHTYHTTIRQTVDGVTWYTGAEVYNLPLGITYGVFFFIIGVLLWRLVCEVIYIVLSYFKSNTKED